MQELGGYHLRVSNIDGIVYIENIKVVQEYNWANNRIEYGHDLWGEFHRQRSRNE